LQPSIITWDAMTISVLPTAGVGQLMNHGFGPALARHRDLAPPDFILGHQAVLLLAFHIPAYLGVFLLIQELTFLLNVLIAYHFCA
jgi:hypothetical protein